MNLTEEIKKILGAESLTEETFASLASLVESHVNAKLEDQETKHLEEATEVLNQKLEEAQIASDEQLETRMADFVAEQTKRIDAYVDTAVQEFITENKKSFEQLEEFERTKTAMAAILESFEKHGFTVNKDANTQKVLAEAAEREKAFTELFDRAKTLEEMLQKVTKELIFNEAVENLADTQKEKVVKLSESVTFNSLDEYKTGIKLIVEQVAKEVTEKPATVVAPPAPVVNKLIQEALAKL